MSGIRPSSIRLEASSYCQLRCPSCPTTSKAIQPTVGSGFLTLENFQNLIRENPWLRQIELSNYGEIFLNPDLVKLMKFAHASNVALKADNGVNLNSVRDDVLEALVKYKFRSMTCSIDGASNGAYQIYRVRGNLTKVINNIRKINQFKKKYGSQYPELLWQFVVFGHNEKEIQAAKKMADELNMSFYLKLSWEPDFSPIRDHEFIREEIGAASREEYSERWGVDYMQSICYQLWDEPQINWDGKVLGCCRNFWGDFGGNAFDDGLLNSLNNEKMDYAREMLQGNARARKDIPCTTCGIYLAMQAAGSWLMVGSKSSEESESPAHRRG